MSVYLQDPDVTLYNGDALEVLRTLPDRSVHMCATSPPFYGLRDYGTGTWEGGDEGCDHKRPRSRRDGAGRERPDLDNAPGSWAERDARVTSAYVECECGARRIDRQIGLEESPDEWVARLVEVFREVRRVLRDDGTLWVEIGSSFVAGDMRPSRSQPRPSAPACDSDDTELQGSPATGSAYLDLCDGCLADFASHLLHNERTDQHLAQSEPPDDGKGPHSENRASSSLQSESDDVRESTILASWLSLRDECSDCANRQASADRAGLRSVSLGARQSAHSSAYSDGTTPLPPTSAVRSSDTAPSVLAWGDYTSRLKAKDLLPQPWMLAMALQYDGWILRSEIVWSKSNPMPESVTDRPTKAHSTVFLLSKKPRYFYDAEAVREKLQTPLHAPGNTAHKDAGHLRNDIGDAASMARVWGTENGANARSVWQIATEPTPFAHFATWPQKLVSRMILAGTSERGVCPECGAPWVRETGRGDERNAPDELRRLYERKSDFHSRAKGLGGSAHQKWLDENPMQTLGWRAGCDPNECHGAEVVEYSPVPATCLDVFGGSGTTALVARKLGRRAVLIELNESYCELAAERLAQQSLFAVESA